MQRAKIDGGERHVIGASEYVALPEWRVRGLKAKIDTGARTSALHVEDIEEIGRGRVRFTVRLARRDTSRRVHVEEKIVRRGRVRSSNGAMEQRLFVRTTLRIGPVEREADISLVDRGEMIFRMLVGREALGHAYLVDPSRRYLLGEAPRAGKKKSTKAKKKAKKKKVSAAAKKSPVRGGGKDR